MNSYNRFSFKKLHGAVTTHKVAGRMVDLAVVFSWWGEGGSVTFTF